MSEEKKEERGRILDKVLMGVIIGGAIGSVVGASIAPKKGTETRKDLVKTSGKVFSFLHKLTHIFKKKNNE